MEDKAKKERREFLAGKSMQLAMAAQEGDVSGIERCIAEIGFAVELSLYAGDYSPYNIGERQIDYTVNTAVCELVHQPLKLITAMSHGENYGPDLSPDGYVSERTSEEDTDGDT